MIQLLILFCFTKSQFYGEIRSSKRAGIVLILAFALALTSSTLTESLFIKNCRQEKAEDADLCLARCYLSLVWATARAIHCTRIRGAKRVNEMLNRLLFALYLFALLCAALVGIVLVNGDGREEREH